MSILGPTQHQWQWKYDLQILSQNIWNHWENPWLSSAVSFRAIKVSLPKGDSKTEQAGCLHGCCHVGNSLWGEVPYLLRDLVLAQEVSQTYRFTATPQLGFRWQCVFCTFCNVSISTVKSPAEMTSSCSESEGSCNSFFTSLFTEATRSTIQALAHGTAHTIILLCSLLSSMMCVSYRLNPNDVNSVLL